MKRRLRIVKTLFLTYYAGALEYRAEILLFVLSGSLPLIMMGIWMKAASVGNFALSSNDFARYFLLVFVMRQLNVVWVVWDFENEILLGRLSPQLLRPLDPVWYHAFVHIAERFARLPFIAALVVLFFVLYPQAFWIPGWANCLWFVLATLVALVLRFLMQYTLALLCFWLERAAAIEEFWTLPYTLLSGMLAPLEVFPDAIRHVALWTPYPYFIHFPATLLLGFGPNIGKGMAIMALWIAILLPLNRWLWRQGLKQYSGMGA